METSNKNIELINKYLKGKMTPKELEDFQKELKADMFLSDALEGYKLSGASASDLDSIRNNIIKKSKSRKLIRILFASGIAATISFILIYFLSLHTINIDTKAELSQKQFIKHSIIKSDNDEIDSIKPIPTTNLQIKPYTAELRTIPQEVIVPESISPLFVNNTLIIDYSLPEIELKNIYHYRSNHYFTYLQEYKVVDYRYDKRLNIQKRIIPTNNIEHTNYSGSLFQNTKEYTYVAFLEDALEKIQNKNYYNAIDDFDIILDQYPNDLNAVFYKAICFYELNNNDKSMKLFDFALNNKINTFHEDAKWYSSMILKEEKQYAASEKVLEEIVLENGYYGVQAKKELDELYKLYIND